MSIQIQANWEQTNPASADYIKNKPTLAAVATSGSYNDLTDKPSMAIDNELDASSSNAVSNSIVTSSLEKKANVFTEVATTLLAANWVGTTAPYSYTLTINGITSTSNQEFLPVNMSYFSNLSDYVDYIDALQGANIQDNGQSENTANLIACGEKPTIDLPIKVIMRGDA